MIIKGLKFYDQTLQDVAISDKKLKISSLFFSILIRLFF